MLSVRTQNDERVNRMSEYRPLLKALYLVAVLLILVPVSEHVGQVLPFRFGNPTWRFGAAGLFSGSLPGTLLGIALMLVLAAALKQRRTMRVLGAVSMVLALALLVVLVMFGLDFLQVRAGVNPRVKPPLDRTVIRALLVIGFSTVTAAIVGIAAWRSSAPDRRSGAGRSAGFIYRSQPEGGKVAGAGAGESVVASASDAQPNQEEGRSR